MNRRGSLFDIIAWVVIAFVVIFFLGIWLYGHQLLTDSMTSLPDVYLQSSNTTINMSQIGADTFGKINSAEQTWLPIIGFIIIVCEALVILISNYFIKEHPIMFIPYVFVTAIAIVVSAILSNIYQGFLTGYNFSLYLQHMTMANYVMIYLPYWTGVIGAFGAILLMAQIIIPSQEGVA